MISAVDMEDMKPDPGTKYDGEKPRMDLLDSEWLEEVAKVLTFGAKKYTTYGECDCLVSIVKEIQKYGPKDFVNLATILRTNESIKSVTMNTRDNTEKLIKSGSLSINANTWWTTLTSLKTNVCLILEKSTDSPLKNSILSLHNLLVQFVDQTTNSVSTTTIPQEKLEQDFVKDVTLLLVSLNAMNGTTKHSNTCSSLKEIKTGSNNWRGGIAYSRLIAAAYRHLGAINRGEDIDPESGLPHVAHLSCCVMFLSSMMRVKPALDDRYKQ